MYTRYLRERGFSLIEMLIVVAIIGVLASVIMPAMNEAREKAKVAATLSELDGIMSAMTLLYNDTGYYPNGAADYCRTTLPSGNEVNLSLATSSLTANGNGLTGWNGPYFTGLIDKWGTPYYLDEDYQCYASTRGCKGLSDTGADSKVLVSCGPNQAVSGGSCDYDGDNIVLKLCD